MKSMVLAAALLLLSTSAVAEDTKSNEGAMREYKKEIIARCKQQMGSYGASLVKACVDEDIKALIRLSNLPDNHNSIVSRCLNQMREYGFSLVLACAEEDIKAQEALDNY